MISIINSIWFYAIHSHSIHPRDERIVWRHEIWEYVGFRSCLFCSGACTDLVLTLGVLPPSVWESTPNHEPILIPILTEYNDWISSAKWECILSVCLSLRVRVRVRADLPFRPGTAAIQMILAEHTAMQASTVGSSLMFRRHTCRESGHIINSWPRHETLFPKHLFNVRRKQHVYPDTAMWGSVNWARLRSVFHFFTCVNMCSCNVCVFMHPPVPHSHRCYTPRPHTRCLGSCGWERRRRTRETQQPKKKKKNKKKTKTYSLHSHVNVNTGSQSRTTSWQRLLLLSARQQQYGLCDEVICCWSKDEDAERQTECQTDRVRQTAYKNQTSFIHTGTRMYVYTLGLNYMVKLIILLLW